jgi:hypothetical protein
MPKCLESLNENIEQIGTAMFRKRREKLRKRLSNIGPGLLFDRTDRVLLQARKVEEEEQTDSNIITISKYEKAIAEQSQLLLNQMKLLGHSFTKLKT